MKLLLSGSTKQQLKAIKEHTGSYLFSGPKSVGKYTTAKYLASQICAQPSDVLEVEAEKSSLKIEQITELQRQLQLKTVGGNQRVVIVRDAHLLTREAQNAFLKTLEEPPADTTIILTVTQTDSLAATILSRCKKITFPRQVREDINNFLVSELGFKAELSESLSGLCGGAIGKAVALRADDELRDKINSQRKIAVTFVRSPLYERLLLTQQIIQAGTTDTVLTILGVIRHKLRAQTEQDTAYRLSRVLSVGEELLRYLKGNGNAKLAVDRLAIELG